MFGVFFVVLGVGLSTLEFALLCFVSCSVSAGDLCTLPGHRRICQCMQGRGVEHVWFATI